MANTKQLKINKLFRKTVAKIPEDCKEIQEEIRQLKEKLKEKHDELFQLQRNSYRHKVSAPKKGTEAFIRPETIILNNAVESLKRNIELMSMLSGMEVQSYVENDHCCIVFHMQHDSQYQVKHGLRIEMNSGVYKVSQSSLPLGFNLGAVMEEFDNVMLPDCLHAIRSALVAYYDRLEQYEGLKKLLNVEAQLFKVIDGSHIEISFMGHSDNMEEDDERIEIILMLDYGIYDIRPKTFSFKEIDLPEGTAEVLREQCLVFESKPLRKAFKEAFITGIGSFKLTPQVGPRPVERPRRRPKPRPQHYHNDDTFHPEDCSDPSDGNVSDD